eukprot:GHVR01089945.1.p1 GENE.GHVR01089945.1~~GHVR01089945.1.p1  ORF type:complete len:161 (+),score=16.95 GHVR01089945.1:143-625(+)
MSEMATVYVWTKDILKIYWGHASLKLTDGTYISWGPWDRKLKASGTNAVNPIKAFTGVKSRKMPSYEKDVEAEGKPADLDATTQLPDILNEEIIKNWWHNFEGPYHATEQNCCNVVYQALREGGSNSYVDSDTRNWAEKPGIWYPSSIDTYAKAIKPELQ